MTNPRDPIFDGAERRDCNPAGHGESTFDFLNRVSGDYWHQPRQLMQTWADHITDDEDYNDLCQRFRSGKDDQFRSAFLELYIHECLMRSGFAVTVHPSVPHTPRRPDFYAERDGFGLYLEAIAPGTSAKAEAAANRRAVLLDTVNQLRDPNFTLCLERLREGPNPPASARLRNDLRGWLAGLNPDDYSDLEHAPQRDWQHGGWATTFKAIPKREHARGVRSSDRAIGVYAYGEASFIDDAPAIRRALDVKHHAYGDLSIPFVVAVGTYIHDSDYWHSTNALYGNDAIQFGQTVDGETVTRAVRQPDGYFGVPPDWQNRNVSAVLLVNQLMPYHVHKAETTLWRHPNPLHPLPDVLGFPGVTVGWDGAHPVATPSPITAANLFGLSEPWPPGEPWPKSIPEGLTP
ncbi:hypothetical protein [Rhodococcus sp. MTM3W5.2]|uniref:hypothetical protein n=1 Tax=Rhodococcus sp. MTM3W5.2 TaxID=1805827 RepID=UPI0011AEBF78|nr:hypothetical protein [Rhodococcus sp. MTM3W5.2]